MKSFSYLWKKIPHNYLKILKNLKIYYNVLYQNVKEKLQGDRYTGNTDLTERRNSAYPQLIANGEPDPCFSHRAALRKQKRG